MSQDERIDSKRDAKDAKIDAKRAKEDAVHSKFEDALVARKAKRDEVFAEHGQ